MMKLITILMMGMLAVPAWAGVTMRIEWQLNGPLAELQAAVKEGKALQAKINPKVRHELWANVVHGENVNSASLISYFENLAHFAEATAREEANAEWTAFISRFPIDRFPITFNGLSTDVVGESSSSAEAGDVLAILVFNTGGDVAGLAEQVNTARALQAKINRKAKRRQWSHPSSPVRRWVLPRC